MPMGFSGEGAFVLEITLLRHGEPEFGLKGIVRADEIPKIITCYNQSGIKGLPPEHAIQTAQNCNAVICSNLPRSLLSAEALGVTGVSLSHAIFREIALPHFKGGAVTLPLSLWLVVLRSLSAVGFSKNGESMSMAKARAKQAAAMLVDLARCHDRVLLVGHGFLNYFIAKELLSNNWQGPAKPGGKYWEYAVYKN